MEETQNTSAQDQMGAVVENQNLPDEGYFPIFNPLKNTKTVIGMGILILSFFVFVSLLFVEKNNFDPLNRGLFYLPHFAIMVYYFVAMFSKKEDTKWYSTRINSTFLWLVSFQLGAFMLNLSIKVFPESVAWLQVVLTVHCLAMIALTFRDFLSEKYLNYLYFIMGVGLVVDVYFMLCVVPLTGFAVLTFWFMGLSFYAWSPILKVIYSLNFLFKSRQFGAYFGKFYLSGVGFSLLMVLLFNWSWLGLVHKTRIAVENTKSELPKWVRVAQALPPSVLTEELLKSDLRGGRNMMGFDNNGDRWHNPLVVIGNTISPFPNLDLEERSAALKAIFNDRKYAENRLWNGENLKTSHVNTAIQMFPNQRMAYTEQTLTIQNTQLKNNARWSSEEAIYIFRLPEGGVVSSLSLWVNGIEQKSYLTTTGKADSAYKTIVGREFRDPSVIHWCEGNAVSVRVFPCRSDSARMVKIGFTTPLRFENKQLHYENVLFEGPPALTAKAQTTILGVEKVQSKDLNFDKKDKKLEHNGKYLNDGWSINFDAPSVLNDAFSYKNKNYHAVEYTPQYEAFEPSEIYLDINKSWSADLENIWEKVKNKRVYAFSENKMLLLNEGNFEAVSRDLLSQNFSVFPLFDVKNPLNALILTKNTAFTPDFRDLNGSKFMDNFKEKMSSMTPVRVFSIGSTTYWNTLKQLRLAQIQCGNLSDFDKILTEKVFLKNEETAEKLVIEPSKIIISEDTFATQKPATDHLFRLWAYNKSLALIGKNYFDKNYNTEGVVQLAERANIVTPVSSLIVLETQKDYDRFDIKRNNDALGNATLNNAGAAPEPHEWALILVGICAVIFTQIKRRFY